MGFVADKVKLGQVFLQVRRVFPFIDIAPMLRIYSSIIRGMNSHHVKGCRPDRHSLMQSHPTTEIKDGGYSVVTYQHK
jgi:hypothetical protein